LKVLFLDIDGVLNTYRSPGYLPINDKRLRMLRRIVKETGCIIVLSSTWRKLPETLKRAHRKLGYKGLKIHSTTTKEQIVFGRTQHRGHEIQHWLDKHPDSVETYAIVDDDSDMLLEQMDYYVKTDGDEGLTEEKADVIIAILNRKDKK
jgi:HAD domain in Swiss Army Knife RNA repair proteins